MNLTKKELKEKDVRMYNCIPCAIQFVRVHDNHFCYRCKLLAMFSVDDSLPF